MEAPLAPCHPGPAKRPGHVLWQVNTPYSYRTSRRCSRDAHGNLRTFPLRDPFASSRLRGRRSLPRHLSTIRQNLRISSRISSLTACPSATWQQGGDPRATCASPHLSTCLRSDRSQRLTDGRGPRTKCREPFTNGRPRCPPADRAGPGLERVVAAWCSQRLPRVGSLPQRPCMHADMPPLP